MNTIFEMDRFLSKSSEVIKEIISTIDKLPSINLKEFSRNDTAFVIVDMINGFAREGALRSDRVEALIPEISKMSKLCDDLGIIKIAFADCHNEESIEFDSYPKHCIAGTSESEMVKELKEIEGYKLIPKNSTNGFLEEEFQRWLSENSNISNFIIVGDCTDICIDQFSKSLRTYFNIKNKKARVIVPLNMVDTYDVGVHYAELMNVMSVYSMMINGVEIVKSIN